jgi:hypothetical protein
MEALCIAADSSTIASAANARKCAQARKRRNAETTRRRYEEELIVGRNCSVFSAFFGPGTANGDWPPRRHSNRIGLDQGYNRHSHWHRDQRQWKYRQRSRNCRKLDMEQSGQGECTMAQLMRTSNPVLNEKRFEGFSTLDRGMTLQGTVNKTGLLLLCSIATAAWTWNLFMQSHSAAAVMPYLWIGSIGGFVCALVTVFKKEWAP